MALTKAEQQKLALTVLMVAGFGYVYYAYMLKPVNAKIVKTTAEKAEVLDRVESMKRTAQRLPALQKEYDALLTEVGKSEKRLPRDRNLQEVLRLVTERAQEHSISVQTFGPGSDTAQPSYTEVPVALTVSGMFHDLGGFLADLGNQERIMKVKDVRLSAAQKKGQTVTATFTLITYVFAG